MSSLVTIEISRLSVEIGGNEIIKGIDFELKGNECVAIVGESGSGKTMTVRSFMGLLPKGAKPSGKYKIDGVEFNLESSEKQWRNVRGTKIGMIMQDPFTALDPIAKCGVQILNGVPKDKKSSFDINVALREVGLSEEFAGRYPFELSGGQRQRIVIAAALATQPGLLIADEATTALDVVTQKEILDLIDSIRAQRGMPLIIITHDLRLARERADRILVMDKGVISEQGGTESVIGRPQKTAALKLLEAERFLQESAFANSDSKKGILLNVIKLNKTFGGVHALIDADVDVCAGECVGIAGQSGSGKTTLARCVAGLTKADSGEIQYFGRNPAQIVFQDPYSSLNPAHKVRFILEEALKASGRPIGELDEILTLTELPHKLLDRKPTALSGGERQRVAIARALAPCPDLLICDESVSALDVVIQNQILKMLERLRRERGFSVLFITHDLSVLRMIASRVYVMNHGRVVESGTTEQIFSNAKDEYTKTLIEAAAFVSE